jgi:zinc protease
VAQIWYKVGASDETRPITGISHALEHMMFQGTPKLPGDGFAKLISKVGGKNNAFTGDDFTAYYEEIDVSNLELSFEAEADRMTNLTLPKAAFDKEIQVVIEERRMRTDDNPNSVTLERFMAVANPIGPYHNPVVGWREDLDRMTVEDLKTWYQKWYTPNNAILVVVGDVKAEDVFELARKHFEKIPARVNPRSPRQGELISLGEKRLKVNMIAQLPYLLIGYDVPSLKSSELNPEVFALFLVSAILDGGQSSRFNRFLVRDQMVAAKADTYYDPFKKYSGQFLFSAVPAEGKTVKELEDKIMAQIALLQKEAVSDEELQKAKNQILAQLIFERDSMSDQATMLGLLETVGLPWNTQDLFVEKIKAVTADDVQQVAQKYFVPNSMTVAELVPVAQCEPKKG